MDEPSIVAILEELGCPSGAGYVDLLRHMRTLPGDKPAVYFEDEVITYEQLLSQVAGAVEHLESTGLGRGSHVASLLSPQPAALVTWLAVTAMGGVLIPLYNELGGEALAATLQRLDVEAVVVEPERVAELEHLAPAVTTLRMVLAARDSGFDSTSAATGDIDRILARDYPSSSDLALLLSTSGTTGTPKGVEFAQTYAGSPAIARRKWGLEGELKAYISTSWGHGFAGFVSGLAFWSGGSIVIARRFTASRYWEEIARHECNYVQLIGTQPLMLMAQRPLPHDRAHNVKYLVSTGMPAHIWQDFEERYGVKIWEFYGGTDTAGSFICNPGLYPMGSIGRPWQEFEAKVVTADRHPAERGDVGYLMMRPKATRPVVAYYKDPGAGVEKVDAEGWVWLGDLVRQDLDGNFYFVDRGRDLIRRRGINIAPATVEQGILTHPAVSEASALGVPSDIGEDEVKLVVVCEPGTVTERELAAHAEGALPEYMRPRFLELVSQLPRTLGTEKVQRFRLREGWRNERTWDVQTGAYLEPEQEPEPHEAREVSQ